jgi:hypothetical protein
MLTSESTTADVFPPIAEPSFIVGEITAVVRFRRPGKLQLLAALLISLGAAGWIVFLSRQTGADETIAAPAPALAPAVRSVPLPLPPTAAAPVPLASPAPLVAVAPERRLRDRPLRSRGGVRTLAAGQQPAASGSFRMDKW